MRTPWPWESPKEAEAKDRALLDAGERTRRRRSATLRSLRAGFRDADDEVKATGDDAAVAKRRERMGRETPATYEWAQRQLVGRVMDDRDRGRALMRKFGTEFQPNPKGVE